MQTMQDDAIRFAETALNGTVRRGVLLALENLPKHLAPRILLDSLSPWIEVNTIPGPILAVWRETGAVYEVKKTGSLEHGIREEVSEEPIAVLELEAQPMNHVGDQTGRCIFCRRDMGDSYSHNGAVKWVRDDVTCEVRVSQEEVR